MIPQVNENHPGEPDPFYVPEGDGQIDPSQYSNLDQVTAIIDELWFNEKDTDKLWGTLKDKKIAFFEAYERRGLSYINRLAYGTYFGLTAGGTGYNGRWNTQSIQFSGENGELIEFSVNEMRSFVDQIVNMITKQRPAFQAQATNTDFESMAQVESSDTVVTYFLEQYFTERKEKEVVKTESLYGKSYTHIEWDPDGGPEIEVTDKVESPVGALPQKKKVKAGEFIINRCYPWEVICEPFRSEYEGHLWRLVVLPKRSKGEMIARYPIKAVQINESCADEDPYEYHMPGADPSATTSEDMCSIHVFYYARSAARPNGRKCLFVNNICVEDEDLPIDEIPIIPFLSCELHGTSFGISDMWNLMPLEQMQNQVLSDIATNVEAFGRPPLALPEGTDMDLDALANGQKVVFVPRDATAPQPIKFPQVPDISLKVIEMLRAFKQSITGLNAIARGDTSSAVTSGAYAALYSNLAVEAQSPRQVELDVLRERVGNMILSFLKKFAQHPMLVSIAGKDERAYMDTFDPEDWNGIHRVIIKTANPMLRTQAGRMQVAEILRDWPGQPLKDPARIVDLITTGQMKPLYDPQRITDLRIRWENEQLLNGPPTQQVLGAPDPMTGVPSQKTICPSLPVLPTENAAAHIVGHLEVLYSPAAQKNPAIAAAAMAHVMEHVEAARMGDPYLAQLLSNPPPYQAQPSPAQEKQPNSPDQGKGANGSPTQASSQAVADLAKDDSSQGPRLPKPAQPPTSAAS